MIGRIEIARSATAEALRVRHRAGYSLRDAICVYDLVQSLDIEVRFLDVPSMEGMYYNSGEPHIIVSSLRPPGRRTFTCAHELGHHTSDSVMHVDELLEQRTRTRFDPGEFAADCFAGALLMPKMAVERAFAVREWTIGTCTPGQVYVVSNYFGVGYSTLVHHLRSALHLVPNSHAEQLLRCTPRRAQAMAIGWETSNTAWVVDRHWTGRPIDVEANDLIYVYGLPFIEGTSVELVKDWSGGRLLRACQPGISRLDDSSDWSSFIRVSRRGFVGRNIFRHQEESEGV